MVNESVENRDKQTKQNMKTYLLHQLGREAIRLDGNKSECRKQLQYLAKQELRLARLVSKQATMHRKSADSYLITLGEDPLSSWWTNLAIQAVNE